MVREQERGEQKSKGNVFSIILGMTPYLEKDSNCITTDISVLVTKIRKNKLSYLLFNFCVGI